MRAAAVRKIAMSFMLYVYELFSVTSRNWQLVLNIEKSASYALRTCSSAELAAAGSTANLFLDACQ